MNLAELEKLATEAQALRWTKDLHGWVQDCDTWEAQAYIAACSPDVILRLVAIAKAAERLIPAMDECREIARRWEPDDSSGKERQWLVRGKDAVAALRAALSPLTEKEKE